MTTIQCQQCGQAMEIPAKYAHVGGICDACIDAEQRTVQRKKLALKLHQQWQAICPALYADTNIDKLPFPRLSGKAMEWPGCRSARGLGLNLWGFPRTGKTRTVLLILKREHYAGASVRFLGPSEFAEECELRNFDSASWIRRMKAYDLLAFDDIDKAKLRLTHEEKFFSLLDARFRNFKPTFFTGNTGGDQLKTLFRNGESIVARLREHCLNIHFPQQSTLDLK